MTADCLFCKIAQGQIPCVKVYEDDLTISFMDIMPQSTGHLLVVPKAHGANIWDINASDASATIVMGQRLAKAAKTALGSDGVSLMQLNGAAAGQTIFHVHLHVIPRWAGNNLRMHARDMVDPTSLVPIAAKIAAALQPS
jgi:histidine triad (HIT) family protein